MNKDFYNSYHKLESEHWWFRVRQNIIRRLIYRYAGADRKNIKILDFGCGSGYLVGEFQGAGFDAYGIDNHSESIEYGTQKGIKNLSVGGDDQRINFPDNSFDFVLAMDVVEHIKDDAAIARELNRVVKRGGYIFVTVPAYMWLWGIQDEVALHFRRYTLSGIRRLFSGNSDIDIIFGSYFNTFLFPFIALVRLLEKIFKSGKRESDFEMNNSILNTIFYGVFNLETLFLNPVKYPFGVSILLISKKK